MSKQCFRQCRDVNSLPFQASITPVLSIVFTSKNVTRKLSIDCTVFEGDGAKPSIWAVWAVAHTHTRATLTLKHSSLGNVLEGTIHHCTIQNVFYNVCKKMSSTKVRLIYLSTESGRAPGSEGVCYSSDLHVQGIRQHVRSKYYIEHFKIDYWETLQLIRAKKINTATLSQNSHARRSSFTWYTMNT